MSTQYEAIIAIGLKYREFKDPSNIEMWLQIDDIQAFQPYSNAPIEDCVIGFEYEKSGSGIIDCCNFDSILIRDLSFKFYKLTNQSPKKYFTLNVY